jgi:hypothetical protein
MTSHSGGSVHTQSCGRILRKVHGDIIPTVWDLVDDFGVYKNQAKKRLDYYKKQNYEIYRVDIPDSDEIPIDVMINKLDKLERVETKKPRLVAKTEEYETNKCLLDEEDY